MSTITSRVANPATWRFSARRCIWLTALIGVGASAGAMAQSAADSPPPSAAGGNSWTFAADNDFLALSHRDAGYTGGFLFTTSGPNAAANLVSLDRVLGFLDSWWLPGATSTSEKTGLQFGAQAYTPVDKKTRAPIYNDRPYAGLFSLTSTRMTITDAGQTAWSSALTLGLLGTSLGKYLHRGFHQALGGQPPNGYSHQISEGGEPTLEYRARRQGLLAKFRSVPGGRADLKWGVEAGLGYLTEASLLVSGRYGKYSTPWWSLYPERSEYYAPPATSIDGDLYLLWGASAIVRGYNVLLQGQFRHSDVTLSYNQIEPVLGEAHLGVVWGITRETSLSYVVRFQSAEIKNGPGGRDTYVGSLYLNIGF